MTKKAEIDEDFFDGDEDIDLDFADYEDSVTDSEPDDFEESEEEYLQWQKEQGII